MQESFPQPVETKSERRKRLVAEHNAKVAPRTRTVIDLTSEQRAELKALSQEVFGASSRWQKLVNTGYAEIVTEEVTELVPGATEEEEPTTRTSRVPVKNPNGTYNSVTKRHTVDSIREYMIERKAQLDAMRAEIKRRQDEARAQQEQEQLAKKVQEELAGSAI